MVGRVFFMMNGSPTMSQRTYTASYCAPEHSVQDQTRGAITTHAYAVSEAACIHSSGSTSLMRRTWLTCIATLCERGLQYRWEDATIGLVAKRRRPEAGGWEKENVNTGGRCVYLATEQRVALANRLEGRKNGR